MEEKNIASSDEDVSKDEDPPIYCSLCKTGFSGPVPYRQHLKGSAHQKAESKEFMKKKYGKAYLKALGDLNTSSKANSNADEPTVVEDADNDSVVFTCQVCKKVCTGHIPYQLHLASKKHTKEVRKQKIIGNLKSENVALEDLSDKNPLYDLVPGLKPFAYCATCKKPFSGPESYDQHLGSEAHKKELRKLKLLETMEQNGTLINSKDGQGLEDENGCVTCTMCEKSFSGPIPYQQHLLSDIHKSKAEELQLVSKVKDMMVVDEDGTMHCAECGKAVSGARSLYQHIKGPAHSKQRKKDNLAKDLLTKYPEFMKESTKLGDHEEDSDSDADLLLCTICHKSFSGPESARDHFLSKKHLSAKKEKLLIEKIKQKKNSGKAAKRTATNGSSTAAVAQPATGAGSQAAKEVKKPVADADDEDGFEVIQ